MGPVQRRLLKVVGESRFWQRTGRVHAWVYRRSGGRVGHAAGRISNLLLTTTGRRSGVSRTVPLAYVRDGAAFVVVASNGGSDRHPAWWLNLQARPEALVQAGTEVVPVRARAAHGGERERLWARCTAVNPFYQRYEQITARAIPVVVLERRTQATRS